MRDTGKPECFTVTTGLLFETRNCDGCWWVRLCVEAPGKGVSQVIKWDGNSRRGPGTLDDGGGIGESKWVMPRASVSDHDV